jgi:hypothetical protein
MRRERRDAKETLEIGLTIKEKPRKRQKPAQNSAFQIETTKRTENKENREQKKSITQ